MAVALTRNVIVSLLLGAASNNLAVAYLMILGMPLLWVVSTFDVLKRAGLLRSEIRPRLAPALTNGVVTGAALSVGALVPGFLGLAELPLLMELTGPILGTLQFAALYGGYGAVICVVTAFASWVFRAS